MNFELIKNFLNDSYIYFKEDVEMKKLTSFKIGGVCKIVAYPENISSVLNLISYCVKNKVLYFFLGNGSNILFCDEGFFGVAICSKKLNKIKILSNNRIYCESGVNLALLCKFCLIHSLSGVEELYGVPGSIGGAIAMNAGAFSREIKDVVECVLHVGLDGKVAKLKLKDLNFSYRHSRYENGDEFILAAVLQFKKGDEKSIEEKMNYVLKKRKEKQPLNFPSAGSVFKRPKDGFAAKLIEECGLKGLSVGDAVVSKKHCGFIVNKGVATAKDVLKLIEKIKCVVEKQKGVKLEEEIKFIGWEVKKYGDGDNNRSFWVRKV